VGTWIGAVVSNIFVAPQRWQSRFPRLAGEVSMTSVLPRYVIREILGYTGLVMSVLMILIGLYLFLSQTDELGIGRYGMFNALVVVVCRLPQQAFTLLPIAGLIGALLALGNMARAGELVVMRAAGVSVFRLASWVAAAGAILTALTWGLGDYLAPPAEQFANQYKTLAKTNQYFTGDNQTLWAKDGNVFVSVQRQTTSSQLDSVYIMRFDDQHRLQSIGRADSAKLDKPQIWRLQGYSETRFVDDHVAVSQQATAELNTNLSAEFLGSASADPTTLTGRALLRYVRYLDDNQLESDEYRTAFWIRVARTCTLLVIVMLAVPFSFGPMRSSGLGTRMVIGILVGATFFLLAKLFDNGRLVYDLDPLVVAWGPTTILVVVTGIALARVR
jgi:lipopolysaccharide export system permease protein